MSNPTAITPDQVALVKETWSKVVPIADTAATLFYDRLFETNPQLAPMFEGIDLPEQRNKLIKAINMVVMSLDRIDTLVPNIRELGQRHAGYGVEDAHYGDVGAALLWTLESGLGDAWSDDAAVAWTGSQPHPVFCLLHRSLLPHLGRFLEAGGRKIDAWYADLKVAKVAFDDQAEAFANFNTLDELNAAERDKPAGAN